MQPDCKSTDEDKTNAILCIKETREKLNEYKVRRQNANKTL